MMTQGQETSRWRRDPVRHARADNKAACDSTSVLVNLNILEHFLLLAASLDYRMIYSALLFLCIPAKMTHHLEMGSRLMQKLFFLFSPTCSWPSGHHIVHHLTPSELVSD